MDDIMIRAKDLSMMFNLGIDKGFSLKQGFVDLFDPKKKKDKSISVLTRPLTLTH